VLAAALWFVACFWPHDPAILARAIPAETRFVLKARDLPAAVDECLLNPLVRVFLAAAGVSERDIASLANDPETRKWLEKLSGEECVFGLYREGLFGVSFLGGGAARLRWQLQLFDLPGVAKLSNGGWRYDGDDLDLPPGFHLHFALEDGCLFAWIGENDSGLNACLAAARGQAARLWDGDPASAPVAFLSSPAGAGTLRAWTAPVAPLGVPALMEMDVSPETLAVTAAAPAAGPLAELPAASAADAPLPPAAFADDAVLALAADASAFPWTLSRFGDLLLPWARHALSLAGEFAEGPVYGFLLTGSHGGRLSLGLMRHFGNGLKVPAVLLATPASDEAVVQAKIDRALAESNRRYRGRFVFCTDGDGVRRLASEDGGEWTELLSDDDRPAWALRGGWLWVCSSARALRTVLAEQAVGTAAADEAWKQSFRGGRGPFAAWGNLAAFDAALRDWIGLVQTAQGFMGRRQTPEERRRWRALRTWGEELSGFGSLALGLGGDGAGGAWATLALGDTTAPGAERLLLALLKDTAVAEPVPETQDEAIPPVEPVPVAPPVAAP
jgi:hypothetical protein